MGKNETDFRANVKSQGMHPCVPITQDAPLAFLINIHGPIPDIKPEKPTLSIVFKPFKSFFLDIHVFFQSHFLDCFNIFIPLIK